MSSNIVSILALKDVPMADLPGLVQKCARSGGRARILPASKVDDTRGMTNIASKQISIVKPVRDKLEQRSKYSNGPGTPSSSQIQRERVMMVALHSIPELLPPRPWALQVLFVLEPILLVIIFAFTSHQIDLLDRNDLRTVPQLVARPEDDEGGDSDVGGDEGIFCEGQEGVEALEDSDDCLYE